MTLPLEYFPTSAAPPAPYGFMGLISCGLCSVGWARRFSKTIRERKSRRHGGRVPSNHHIGWEYECFFNIVRYLAMRGDNATPRRSQPLFASRMGGVVCYNPLSRADRLITSHSLDGGEKHVFYLYLCNICFSLFLINLVNVLKI